MIPLNIYSIGPLGIAFLTLQTISIALSSRAMSRVDENPLRSIHKRGSVVAGRVFVVIGLTMVAAMPSFGFLETLLSNARTVLNMIGPLYFPASLALDLIAYVQLHRKERCVEDGLVAWNYLCIPFITLAASLIAQRGNKKLSQKGIHIGYVVKLLRRIVGQATISWVPDQLVRMTGERWEVRSVQGDVEFRYDPESMSNPHIGVFGASGQGKTTHTLYLIYMLSKRYRLIAFDPKGDLSEAARNKGWAGKGLAEIFDVQRIGINPLTDNGNELKRLGSVTRLIEAISVVEDLGSNQKAVLITAADGLRPFTYMEFRKRVEEMLRRAMAGREGGPHIKDAYTGLYNRIRLSGSILRDDGGIDEDAVTISWEGPPIKIYNMSNIADERLRALATEWILRVIYEKARERGPAGFLKERIFIVVDEAHELARAQTTWRRDMTRSILEDLARKGRSYGVNLLIITQRLSDLADGLRSNCSGIWIIFRDVAPADIEILSSLTSCPNIGQVMSNLKTGEALILKAEPQILDHMRVAYDRPTAVTVATIVKTARLEIATTTKIVHGSAEEKPLGIVTGVPPLKEGPSQMATVHRPVEKKQATIGPMIEKTSPKEAAEGEQINYTSTGLNIKEEVCRRITRDQTKIFLASLPDEVFRTALTYAERGESLRGFVRSNLNYLKGLGLVGADGRPTLHCRLLYRICEEILKEASGHGA